MILRYIQSLEPVFLVRKKFKIQYLVVFLKEIKGANNYVSVKMNFPPCYVKGKNLYLNFLSRAGYFQNPCFFLLKSSYYY